MKPTRRLTHSAGTAPVWRAVALAGALAVAGCQSSVQEFSHGAVVTQDQIDLIPVGSSKDQVLLALGSPSTTGEFETPVYYYISQRSKKSFNFSKQKLIDQRVLAVYFDETDTVTRVANYGLQDGVVFDFISRTTPTGGKDLSLLGQLLTPLKGGSPPPTAGTASAGSAEGLKLGGI